MRLYRWIGQAGCGRLVCLRHRACACASVTVVTIAGTAMLALVFGCPPGLIWSVEPPLVFYLWLRTLAVNHSSLHLKHYDPAHTDSDISVSFTDVVISEEKTSVGTAASGEEGKVKSQSVTRLTASRCL